MEEKKKPGRPKKEQTPEKMANDIMESSFGHIASNQTFTCEPPKVTNNTTTIDDLNKESRGIQSNK